jgi:hypothetical protein
MALPLPRSPASSASFPAPSFPESSLPSTSPSSSSSSPHVSVPRTLTLYPSSTLSQSHVAIMSSLITSATPTSSPSSTTQQWQPSPTSVPLNSHLAPYQALTPMKSNHPTLMSPSPSLQQQYHHIHNGSNNSVTNGMADEISERQLWLQQLSLKTPTTQPTISSTSSTTTHTSASASTLAPTPTPSSSTSIGGSSLSISTMTTSVNSRSETSLGGRRRRTMNEIRWLRMEAEHRSALARIAALESLTQRLEAQVRTLARSSPPATPAVTDHNPYMSPLPLSHPSSLAATNHSHAYHVHGHNGHHSPMPSIPLSSYSVPTPPLPPAGVATPSTLSVHTTPLSARSVARSLQKNPTPPKAGSLANGINTSHRTVVERSRAAAVAAASTHPSLMNHSSNNHPSLSISGSQIMNIPSPPQSPLGGSGAGRVLSQSGSGGRTTIIKRSLDRARALRNSANGHMGDSLSQSSSQSSLPSQQPSNNNGDTHIMTSTIEHPARLPLTVGSPLPMTRLQSSIPPSSQTGAVVYLDQLLPSSSPPPSSSTSTVTTTTSPSIAFGTPPSARRTLPSATRDAMQSIVTGVPLTVPATSPISSAAAAVAAAVASTMLARTLSPSPPSPLPLPLTDDQRRNIEVVVSVRSGDATNTTTPTTTMSTSTVASSSRAAGKLGKSGASRARKTRPPNEAKLLSPSTINGIGNVNTTSGSGSSTMKTSERVRACRTDGCREPRVSGQRYCSIHGRAHPHSNPNSRRMVATSTTT